MKSTKFIRDITNSIIKEFNDNLEERFNHPYMSEKLSALQIFINLLIYFQVQ